MGNLHAHHDSSVLPDVDECTVVNGGCQQSCINTLGTFHCECDTGYRLHADERTCIKMDPCTGGNGYAHICQSENEVARCACHPGYQLSEDKKACEDINECVEGLAHCGHRCENTVGSFTCACHPGFELGADGKQCYRIELEIVNSCEKNNGGCSHQCEHALGGPCCSCNHGHQLDSDEKTCIDLVECESEEACCTQLCINYFGGYECSCREGFQISSDDCGCDAKDDELEEEEEELEVVRFAGLLFKSTSQLLHYVAAFLPPTHQDEEDEEEDEKDTQELTALQKVVCLDHTFGHDCSLSCVDCMNGGRCQEGRRGCSCPAGWGGILCNENGGIICDCQNGGTCDPLTGQCQRPLGVHGKTCEHGCPKGFFGNCKRKCNCANCNSGHCHRVYGTCVCEPGCYGRFCHLNCPKGAYGAGCSSECQCVEENTLECNAKNGSCTCKSGYQGNRCQKAATEYTILENASEIPTVKENELKLAPMASEDKSASSPVAPVRMEVNATKKLETVTVLLVTQEKPVPHVVRDTAAVDGLGGYNCHSGDTVILGLLNFVHQAHMGRTVNSYVNVQLRMRTVTQSQGDVPVCLAAMETAVISIKGKEESVILSSLVSFRAVLPSEKIFQEKGPKANIKYFDAGQAECPKGTYGPYCQKTCKCLNGGNRDTMIGTCDCLPGFIGADCSQTCPEGHYGQNCVQHCSCGSGQCDPITGRCQCSPGQMGARCQQDSPVSSTHFNIQVER
ncbi:EGF-like and EMI domain-containing protein 1 [Pteropus alecto]|uniref:EGF-like and EMI domain-containing protein 1 n=1 Tax=Pteropus alecto TaxID=9402 RepID=UPI000D53AA72|nr:EGF-like and EMI domain-containing protein 1 [Pteropus alecto]